MAFVIEYGNKISISNGILLVTANDAPERDPKKMTMELILIV